MRPIFWSACARILSRPAIVNWLIRRATKTPFLHITGLDGSIYMYRYWLFNPYPSAFPISIRLHHIMREDQDRHMHDHPWNARTFILRGYYKEERVLAGAKLRIWRNAGDTAALKFGEYHRITEVSPGGVWTLFVTGKKRGTWGFMVDGAKVQWRKYLGLEQAP